jgi:GT2 family glycosyltransferase
MIAPPKQEANRVSITTGLPPSAVDLSIVIVNWNSAGYVRQCVKAIQLNPPGCVHEIVVVDSGSFDECGEMLGREFPAVRFVQSRTNVGFAAANNLGAASSRGRALLFLNPDTEVGGKALDRLLKTLNRLPDAGLVGTRLLNTDRSLQTSCIQSFPTVLNQVLDAEWLRRIFPRSDLWGMRPLIDETQNPAVVEVISGACIMIKRSVFKCVSGFDERYFMYSEDLDLCYRVRQAGFDCLYVPDAQIVHHGGGSSNSARTMFSTVMTRESVFRFLKFHRGRSIAWCYRLAMGVSSLIRLPLIAVANGAKKLAGKKNSKGSFRKWFAILRWSVGLESWAAKQSSGVKGAEQSVGGKNQGPAATPGESEAKRSCAA